MTAPYRAPMAIDLTAVPGPVLTFLTERHLATLTTHRADRSPHVVPVGFTFDPTTHTARVITFSTSRKVRNVLAAPGGRAAVCQVDGGRWLTLEGPCDATDDPAEVALAVDAYAARYRPPKERDDRWVLRITVDRMMGRA